MASSNHAGLPRPAAVGRRPDDRTIPGARMGIALLCALGALGPGLAGCEPGSVAVPPLETAEDPGLRGRRTHPMVKIKVKRSVSGAYSWDLGGDDVDAILAADAALRRTLQAETE